MRAIASRTCRNTGGVVRTLLGAACALLLASFAARASAASVAVDKIDYSPGETVVITGAGWQAGEQVNMLLHEEPMTHDDRILIAVADANGDFTNTDFVVEPHDEGVSFTLTAIGTSSGEAAETMFTDHGTHCTSSSQCNDSNPCTNDSCILFHCVYTPKCKDLDLCTVDTCNPTDGMCTYTPKDCSDGNNCTTDTCFIGICITLPKECVDFNECTTGRCDRETGECVQDPKSEGHPCLPDLNLCTKDQCNGMGVCTHPPRPKGHACLPDLNLCTKDQCDGYGECEHPRNVRLDRPGTSNQKGSLLMLPKIVVDTAKGVDTLVDITNAGDRDVTVTCYWIDGTPPSAATPGLCRGGISDGQPCATNADCAASGKQPAGTCQPRWEHPDFHFELTARQPAYFKASDGLPGPGGHGVTPFPSDPGKGELKCWASDPFGGPIKYNYLKGEALITDAANGTSWEYAAYGFQCRLPVKTGEACDSDLRPHHDRGGDLDKIHLDGCEFDACPGTLELDFFASNDKPGQSTPLGGPVDTDIALVPCDQDLRQEGEPVTTKEKYEIWNENETKFTGLTRCLTCFDHAKLSTIGGALRRSALTTEKGLARIDGVADDTKCCPKELDASGNLVPQYCSQPTGLLGVQVKEIDRAGRTDRAGTTIHGAGAQAGEICFELNDRSEEGQ